MSLAVTNNDRTAPPFPLESIAPAALADLRTEFSGYGHDPSPDQWVALEALLETFDRLVAGEADPTLYLSSLDPGIGKTSCVVAYLRRLLQSDAHRNAGVLICVHRLDEIRRLATALSDTGGTIAIRTSDPNLNELSNAEPNEAQLLVVTQSRLERMSRGSRKFADARSLFFNGQPRPLRIWDESFLPGRVVTPSSGDAAATLRRLDGIAPEARIWMTDLFNSFDKADDRMPLVVPDWNWADSGQSMQDASRHLRQRRKGQGANADEDLQLLEDFQSLSGKTWTVRMNGKHGTRSLAGYCRSLPDDLLPLVVLDASGRVRTTYNDLAKTWNVHRLPVATKDYENLTINVWSRGGGKSSFETPAKAEPILTAIEELVRADGSNRKWLIVCHKPRFGVVDLEDLFKKRLPSPLFRRLTFLTWGSHAAINDHADTDRVILAGTLFFPDVYYEALKRLCLDKTASELTIDETDLDKTRIGEFAHIVLQALCRASVRKSENGKARPCQAFLIVSKRSGIKAMLPEWFPNCHVGPWEPEGPAPLSGHAKAIYNYIALWVRTTTAGELLRFTTIYRDLGINADVFRDTRRNEVLRTHLTALGVSEYAKRSHATAYLIASTAADLDVGPAAYPGA